MKLPDLSEGQRPTPTPAGGVASYQTEDMGAAMAPGLATSELAGTIHQEADRIGTLQAEDRYTQLRNWQLDQTIGPKGFTSLKGAAAVNGPSLADVSGSFDDAVRRIGDGLFGVGAEKFKQRADIAGSQFKEDFLRHQVQQSAAWAHEVTVTSADSEIRAIAAAPLNENAIGASMARINGLIDAYGNDPHVGLTRGAIDSLKANYAQKATVARLESWASIDPVSAYTHFRENKAEVTDPATRLTLQNTLRAMAYPVAAKQIADKVIAGTNVPDINSVLTVAGAPLQNAVMSVESGGKRYGAGGKLLTSSKGAQGEMQVMPATATDPGFGVAPAQNNSPEELARVGGDYLRAMVTRYNGNTLLALAAYNAGPGAVDSWIAQYGDPNKGEISNAAFQAKIPYAETRKYVTAVASKVGYNPQPEGTKNQTLGQLGGLMTSAENLADAQFPDDPIFRDLAVSQVKSYVSKITAAQEGVAKAAHQNLMAAAMPGANPNPPQSMQELLSIPGAQQAWAQTNPEAQRGVIALVEHNARTARGEFIHTDPELMKKLFQQIHLPESDPNKIRSADKLAPYFAEGLSPSDYDRLRKELDYAQNPEGNAFLKRVQHVRETAEYMLTKSMVGQIQPDIAKEAAYRFGIDLDSKIAAARAGKGASLDSLLVPGPDYVLNPNRVAAFMPSAASTVSAAASKGSPPAAAATQEVYEPGKTYQFQSGTMVFNGGDPYQQSNWKAAPAGAQISAQPKLSYPSSTPAAGAPPSSPALAEAAPAAAPKPAAAVVPEKPMLVPTAGQSFGTAVAEHASRVSAALQDYLQGASPLTALGAKAVESLAANKDVSPETSKVMNKLAGDFRALYATKRYTINDLYLIQSAIASGRLSPPEQQEAQDMLKAIKKATGNG